jgi:hypothetical protein
MKKLITLTGLALLVAAPAFATSLVGSEGYNLTATAPANTVIAKSSKGVKIGVTYDATNGAGYGLTSLHTSGSKEYGTAYDATAIYFRNKPTTSGYTLAAPTSSVAAEAFTSAGGWSAL